MNRWLRLLQFLYDSVTWWEARLHVRFKHQRFYEVRDMANLQWPQLAADGITISVKDSGGNPASLPDPSDVTTEYASSDPSVIVVTPDPSDPYAATGKSTGKSGTGVTISATLNFNSGAQSITGVSEPIDVPVGPPTEVDVNLGPPA